MYSPAESGRVGLGYLVGGMADVFQCRVGVRSCFLLDYFFLEDADWHALGRLLQSVRSGVGAESRASAPMRN